ncbi:MBL fold metallo-hydrolase [Brevibacterium samyangense]|uniref:Metallo-beta-lactamase domain-containing protein n=1 Tax=Brevibacterium samyangense TaxID=366888 RepID=A0ABN2TI86_9MICO
MTAVYVFTSDPVALNSYLVVGSERALVVDTGAGPTQAARILAAFRSVTALPFVVVNTHDHWDHFFGNATFRDAGAEEFLGSPAFVRDQAGSAWVQLHEVPLEHEPGLPSDPSALAVEVRQLADGDTVSLGRGASAGGDDAIGGAATGSGAGTVSGSGSGTDIGADTGTAAGDAEVLLEARLLPGHTETDLVLVHEDLAFVGDLLEEGAPPQFDTAEPGAWAQSLRTLLAEECLGLFLPGHGLPVDREFAQAQAHDVAAVAADDSADVPARSAAAFPWLSEQEFPGGTLRRMR